MLPSSGLTTTKSSSAQVHRLEVLVDHRGGVEMVHRNVEKALNLGRVQVHRQHAVGPGAGNQVGHQLGRDRHAAFVLAVLPGVAEIGNHGRDPIGAGPLEALDHDQQFHQVLVDRRAGRLDDEHVAAANVLVDLAGDFAVGKIARSAPVPSGRPRYSQIRLAKAGWARPVKSFMEFMESGQGSGGREFRRRVHAAVLAVSNRSIDGLQSCHEPTSDSRGAATRIPFLLFWPRRKQDIIRQSPAVTVKADGGSSHRKVLAMRQTAILPALAAILLTLPPPARGVPPAGTPPTLTYEVQIDGETFRIEGNREVTLDSKTKPGVRYRVAVRIAPTQQVRLGAIQFSYDLPAKVQLDAGGATRSAQISHELGFSVLLNDLGRPLSPQQQDDALKHLVKSVTATLAEMKADNVRVTEPHRRTFAGSAAQGITIRYRDAKGFRHVYLLYVLTGPKHAATCVVEYLENDTEDVLPLVKKMLDSVQPASERR